jgi:hypothetical protein
MIIVWSPNEDFGRSDEPFRMRFRSTFQRFVAQIEYSHPWKVLRKRIRNSRRQLIPLFDKPAFSRFLPSQTKILEGWTKDEFLIFEWTFNCSWPKSSTHALEKCFETSHFIFCSSFQNLRLGSIIFPKRWTTNRGLNNWENREKAGLSKRGMSCRRLIRKGSSDLPKSSFGRGKLPVCLTLTSHQLC